MRANVSARPPESGHAGRDARERSSFHNRPLCELRLFLFQSSLNVFSNRVIKISKKIKDENLTNWLVYKRIFACGGRSTCRCEQSNRRNYCAAHASSCLPSTYL
jgi:hypothetical protein